MELSESEQMALRLEFPVRCPTSEVPEAEGGGEAAAPAAAIHCCPL